MRNLNYNHLYYFWVIAKEGSIKGASLKLHLTQPTLSEQLRQFEAFLGVKLFERRARKLEITASGKKIMEFADQIFMLGAQMMESVRKKTNKQVEMIQVGIAPSIATPFVYNLVLPLLRKEEFAVTVNEGQPLYLLNELNNGNMRLIFTPILPADSRKFQTYKMLERTFYAVCHPKYDYLAENFPQSIDGFPFLCYSSESDVHDQLQEYFKSKGVQPKLFGELDEINLMRMATEEGLCFSVLPKRAVENSILQGKLILLKKIDELQSSVYAVTRKSENDALHQVLRSQSL